jgi:hypothetical protein
MSGRCVVRLRTEAVDAHLVRFVAASRRERFSEETSLGTQFHLAGFVPGHAAKFATTPPYDAQGVF